MTVTQPDQNTYKQKLMKDLNDQNQSALRKYQLFFVGSTGLGQTIQYELITALGSMPGAAGYLLRKLFYPRLLRQTGRGTVFGRHVSLRFGGKISLGERVAIDDYTLLDARESDEIGIQIGDDVLISRNVTVQCKGGSITIGDHSSLGAYCYLTSPGGIQIGENAMIAGYSYIGGGRYGTDDLTRPIKDQGPYSNGPVVIGDDVWIAANVIVQDGVRIGRGSVIGSGAVIREDVPEYTIVVPHQRMVMMPRKSAAE